MNVASATLSTAYAPLPAPASTDPANDVSTTPSAQPAAPSSSADTSASSTSGAGSSPGFDVEKQLQGLSKEMIAVMLMTDPVARAKAAAALYKQFASIAKQYAAATAPGRGAAQTQSQENQAANQQYLAMLQARAQGGDPAQVLANATQPTSPDANQQADAALEQQNAQAIASMTPAQAADAAQSFTNASASPAPSFMADQVMDEIKSFASSAQMVYQAAVEEAQKKGKKADPDLKSAMADAKKTLDEAATDVEGAPDASANGYTSSGSASTTGSTSMISVSA